MAGLFHDIRVLIGCWLMEAAEKVIPATADMAPARAYLVRAGEQLTRAVGANDV